MHIKFVLLSFLFLTTNLVAKENDFAVLKTTYTGISTKEKKEVKIERASIIKIIQIKNKFSLITSYGEPLYTYDNVWIPNEYILKNTQFNKIKKWNGDKEIDDDYNGWYTIRKDGSFIHGMFEENGGVVHEAGHLYASSNIYWLKISNQSLSSDTVFYRLNDGRLCFSYVLPCDFP